MAFGSSNLTSRARSAFDEPNPLDHLLGEAIAEKTPDQIRNERIANANAAGYTNIVGNQAQGWGPGGIRTYRDLSTFGKKDGGPMGSLGNLPPILLEALRSDTNKMQAAADEQHAKIGDWENRFNDWLGGSSDELKNLGMSEAGSLKDAAGRAEALGREQGADLTRRADEMRGRVRGDVDKALSGMPDYYKGIDRANKDIDEAYRLGDQSVADYKSALNGYHDLSAQSMSAAASGIRRSFHTAMQQVRTATTPDGRQLSATEQMAAMEQIKFQAGQQVQEQITPLQSHFNDTMMQLRTQLAGLQQNNAGLRIQGAGLRGNLEGQRLQGINTELGGAQIKAGGEQTSLDMVARANEGVRQMYQLGATLREAGSTVATTVQMKALELELNGQVALSQVMLQNPRSIVSYFQSFLALMSVNATQGGGGGFGGGGMGGGSAMSKSALSFGGVPFGQQGGVGAGQGYNKPQRPQRPQNPAGGIMGPPEYQMTGTEEDFFA